MSRDPLYRRKKCLFCYREFIPDPRIGNKQKSCSRTECRQKRKQKSQSQWTQENPDYFRERYASTRVWREAHPEYQRQWRAKVKRKSAEIQDEIQDTKTGKKAEESITFVFPKKFFSGEIQDEIRLKCQENQAVWVAQEKRDTRQDI